MRGGQRSDITAVRSTQTADFSVSPQLKIVSFPILLLCYLLFNLKKVEGKFDIVGVKSNQ